MAAYMTYIRTFQIGFVSVAPLFSVRTEKTVHLYAASLHLSLEASMGWVMGIGGGRAGSRITESAGLDSHTTGRLSKEFFLSSINSAGRRKE